MYQPLIRKLATVEALTEAEMAVAIALCDDMRITRRRRDIIAEGAVPDCIHIIVDGWAARYSLLRDGSRRITAFLLPGDFCDLHAPTLAAMDHGIVAITDCRVAYVPTGLIEAATLANPVLMRALWRSTLVDEAILRQWLVNAGRRDAFDKIAHLFCELHQRLHVIGLIDGNRFVIPATQEEIGDATGLTAVHVNRIVRKLREARLADMAGGAIVIEDVAALRRACGFNANYLHLLRAETVG